MEKEINFKFSLKDIFKAFGDLMWNSEDIIDEDEKLPKELQLVSDNLTKKAEALTDVKSSKSKSKSKSRTKTETSGFAKNMQRKSKAEKQISDDSQIKTKNINNNGREREE